MGMNTSHIWIWLAVAGVAAVLYVSISPSLGPKDTQLRVFSQVI